MSVTCVASFCHLAAVAADVGSSALVATSVHAIIVNRALASGVYVKWLRLS